MTMPHITENPAALRAFYNHLPVNGLCNAVQAAMNAHGYPSEEWLVQHMVVTKRFDELYAQSPQQAYFYRHGDIAERLRTEKRALELVRLRKEWADKWSPEDEQRRQAEAGEATRIRAREQFIRDEKAAILKARAEASHQALEAELAADFDRINPAFRATPTTKPAKRRAAP